MWTPEVPGWQARTLQPSELRAGDRVTATTAGARNGAAVALQVVRPGARQASRRTRVDAAGARCETFCKVIVRVIGRSSNGPSLLIAIALSLLATGAAGAGPPSGSTHDVLDHLADGRSGVSFGLGVAPLRDSLSVGEAFGAVGPEGGRPLDPDPRSTVVSFGLKLAWPGSTTPSMLEPYVALGPALFLTEPDYAGRLLGTRVDPSLRLGARAGAGLNWHLGRRTTLFGAYELTATPQGGLPSSGARGADPEIGGYDLTYGLRFRY